MKINIFGMTLEELRDSLKKLEIKESFRAKQLFHWIYKQSARSFEEIPVFSKSMRQKLNEHLIIEPTRWTDVSVSQDGVKKYLFSAGKNRLVEAAFIPDTDRNTLCVSSQIGCKMGCLFCMTAKQGFQGQLNSGEIISQISEIPESKDLSNLVFMGMGEPLDNYEELKKSLTILTDSEAFDFSAKKVTVSTIGIIPEMERLLLETKVNLAISLHSPFEEERKSLMPVESAYPLVDVIQSLKSHDFRQRKLSFEYIVFEGINDQEKHAKALSQYLGELRCRVNLIPYHQVPGMPFKSPNREKMELFQSYLLKKKIRTTIRKSRGLDIQAACGLLSTKKNVSPLQSEDF